MRILSTALGVPVELLLSRVRNVREAELISKISRSACTLDILLERYELVAAHSQSLQKAWNSLWLAQDPYVRAGVSFIGERMSASNQARSLVLGRMEAELRMLKVSGDALLHFIDFNRSLAEELKAEGVVNLAAEKELLVALEEELVRRIVSAYTGTSLKDCRSIPEFIEALKNGSTVQDARNSCIVSNRE